MPANTGAARAIPPETTWRQPLAPLIWLVTQRTEHLNLSSYLNRVGRLSVAPDSREFNQ
jgi:hypothetical protein